MALDPRIALAGRVTDVGTALATGQQTGERFRTAGVRERLLDQSAEANQLALQQTQQDRLVQGISHGVDVLKGIKAAPIENRAALWAQNKQLMMEAGIPVEQLTSINLANETELDNHIQLWGQMSSAGQQQAAEDPSSVREFQFFQSVLQNPNATEDQKTAAKIQLKLIRGAGQSPWKDTTLPDGTKIQIHQDTAEVRYPTVTETTVDSTDDGEAVTTTTTELTPRVQLESSVEATTALAQAESDIAVDEAARKAEIQLANDAVRREVATLVKEQGQRDKLIEADLAYKSLKGGNLDRIYGFGEGAYPDFMRSEEGKLLQARRNQLLGMLVMAGKGELKGQGPVTDADQRIIEQSVSVLGDEGISAAAAEVALDEAMAVLYRGAGMEFNPGEPVESADASIDSFLDGLFAK